MGSLRKRTKRTRGSPRRKSMSRAPVLVVLGLLLLGGAGAVSYVLCCRTALPSAVAEPGSDPAEGVANQAYRIAELKLRHAPKTEETEGAFCGTICNAADRVDETLADARLELRRRLMGGGGEE